MKEDITKEELTKWVAEYIGSNWHASLGYGHDEDTITRACDDLDWLLSPAGITTKEVIQMMNLF